MLSKKNARVNLLCLAGVMLGLTSMLLPWVISYADPDNANAFDVHYGGFVEDEMQSSILRNEMNDFAMAAISFLGGTFVLLFSMFGVLGQIGGLCIYAAEMAHSDFFYPGVGLAIALFSTLIVGYSIYRPMGPGYYVQTTKRDSFGAPMLKRYHRSKRVEPESTRKVVAKLLADSGGSMAEGAMNTPERTVWEKRSDKKRD